MGILRTFLAIAVTSAHTNMHLCGAAFFKSYGAASVTSFFIISGFYMYLILDTKYGKLRNGTMLFYSNRMWRIYPSYFLVLALSLLAMVLTGSTSILGWTATASEFWSTLANLQPSALCLLIVSNVFMICSNVVEFCGFLPDGSLAPNFQTPGARPCWCFLLFPPVWTLGIEMSFYAIAPFIARCGLALIVPSLVLLYFFPIQGLVSSVALEQFTRVLLPGELWYFLAGMVAYRIYKAIDGRSFVRPVGTAMIAGLALFSALFNYVPMAKEYEAVVYWGAVWATVPFLFALTRHSKIDHWVGEFSYAIYVSHFLVYKMLDWWMGRPPNNRLYYVALIATAAALVYGVERPMERLRQRRVLRASQGDVPPVQEIEVLAQRVHIEHPAEMKQAERAETTATARAEPRKGPDEAQICYRKSAEWIGGEHRRCLPLMGMGRKS